ncbi:MAG: glucokinase [Gammaproteobacteria bacterium]|nr:glucokinase [Gammaproteobacteria bacterium]
MNASLALVADIGGTNARFALADVSLPAPLLSDTIRQLLVTDFPSLVHAAQHYLEAMGNLAGQPRTGVFAVAGRVDGDEARITNHPWLISARATAQALGFHHFHLVNDFTAQAMAVQLLTDDDLAVIGPGTGLGVSGLLVRDGIATALETEGGHVSFAPSNPEELEILRELSQDFGRVSDERLLSGGGLVNIHRALSRLAGANVPTALRPQDITERARQGDAGCARAVEVFCAVFGAIAGDLVLTLGAWDGVYLTGGLVPKLLPELQSGIFRERFEAKGRFAASMAGVPTLAVIHPQAGLLGAAAHARNIIVPV